MKLKLGISLAAVALGLAGCAGASSEEDAAENYPERDVEILVGHGAGGGTDLFARSVASGLEDELGVNFTVVNQEGGAGVVAKEAAANAPADGHTLVAVSAFPVTTAAGTNENDLDVLDPLARFQHDTYALWVHEDSEIDTIDDFVQEAEDNPGEMNIGGTYSLGMDEIAANLLIEESGLDFNYIPMDGDGDMHAGVLGGHIDGMLDEFGPTQGLAEDGSIKPILVFSEDRIDEYPDVPTTVELGWDVTDANERGFMIRQDVDEDIKATLEEAMYNVYNSEEYQEYEENNLLHLREGWLDSDDFYTRLEENIERYGEVIENLE